jgi:hypothetical protein
MQENYQKIGKAAGFPWNAVHLVHFVVKAMEECYLPPPSAGAGKTTWYNAWHVCAAVLAFSRHAYAPNPLRALDQFKVRSSEDVGRIVQALSESESMGVKAIPAEEFAGLFALESIPEAFCGARWSAGAIEDVEGEKQKTCFLIRKHFGDIRADSLVITRRMFPRHMQADLQLALDEALADRTRIRLVGLTQKHEYSGLSFTALLPGDEHYAVWVGPLRYHDVDVGRSAAVPCLINALWLGESEPGGVPYAVVKGTASHFEQDTSTLIEIAVPDTPRAREFSDRFIRGLEAHVEASKCYRGKVLSFEHNGDYHGRSVGIKVHELHRVNREDVILPQATLDVLDRNLVEFVQLRPALAQRGMNLKKGLLFYGPPGTGKTHTIQYLTRALAGHTTFLITAEQVGFLSEYMTLARLLQPSIVVLEDADLIARDRARLEVCEEVLLNKLLNEMDGLKPDSEIIFILTTNRPEMLESALTARPGRVDQAIEFPLPDAGGRAKLARLYAGHQPLEDHVVAGVVKRTEGTSAAFIKELMRRATQYAIARGDTSAVTSPDIEKVVEEMLFSGGTLNRKILGALGHAQSGSDKGSDGKY